jgi:hypothetical protein
MSIRIAMTVGLLIVASSIVAAPAISVHFDTRAVTASGFSPGSQVLFFGVAKIPMTYYSRLWRWQFVVTAEGRDGVAVVQTELDIPVSCVWVIADLRTGQVTLATPRDRGVGTVEVGRSGIHATASRFTFDRSFLDLLYVHAGEGAWIWHAIDGGNGDEDGPNGQTTVDIGKAIRVAGQGAPQGFSRGGTLIAVDSIDLSVLSSDVDTLLVGGQQ